MSDEIVTPLSPKEAKYVLRNRAHAIQPGKNYNPQLDEIIMWFVDMGMVECGLTADGEFAFKLTPAGLAFIEPFHDQEQADHQITQADERAWEHEMEEPGEPDV